MAGSGLTASEGGADTRLARRCRKGYIGVHAMARALFRAVVPVVLGASLLSGGLARGDWPSAAHDARRSARADGVANLTTPAAFWRFRAGGSIGSGAVEPFDVDGDGREELILVSGGRVVAREPQTDLVKWETPLLDNSLQMVGLANLDGVGEPELVAFSNRNAYVLSPSTGTIHWIEPDGEMGTIGAVRIADLDGDAAPDLLVQECGCCAVIGPISGVAYRFASGGSLSTPALSWVSPPANCGSAASFAVVHMRDPAQTEVIVGTYPQLALVDGTTGATIATTPTQPAGVQGAHCVGVNVDVTPAEELLCVRTQQVSGPPGTGHLLTQFRLVGSALEVAWEVPVGDVDGAVVIPPGAIADLDGDGQSEVLLAGKDSSDDWVTLVFDAQTGVEVGSLSGEEVVGSVAIDDGERLILTRTAGSLNASSFGPLGVTPRFALGDRTASETVDRRRQHLSAIHRELVSVDLDGDGARELITSDAVTGADLTAHDVSTGAPQLVAEYQSPASVAVSTSWGFSLSAYGSHITVAQSDGNLHVLDAAWNPLSGNPEVGVRFGNYHSSGTFRGLKTTPVAADLGDKGPPGLLVQTSRGSLDRLDARNATFAQGPSRVWSVPDTTAAQVVSADNDVRVVAIRNSSADQQDIVGLSSAGEDRWIAPLTGVALTDLVVGNYDGDATFDVIVEWGSPFDFIGQVRAIRGTDGGVLWDAPPFGPYNRQPSGGAAADWNQDGVDDFVYHADGTRIRSGADGALLQEGLSGPIWSYLTPILDDVDGDGEDEVTLTAGVVPLGTLDHDIGTVLWQGAEQDLPLPYGTIARCDGRAPVLVSASWQFPARLKLTETSGLGAGEQATVVLAGGEVFPTMQDAELAGVRSGQLVSPIVHSNLFDGSGDQVLVGSDDGWLYALDPCLLTLSWSLFFNAPVGAVIAADVDADGLDEVLVSVADGFLYAIKQAVVPAVQEVRDTDPPSGVTNADVDEITTIDTLHAAWDVVEGAVAYEVAFVRAEVDGGGLITDGWLSVGDITATSVGELPLVDGKRYFAAVRAQDAQGNRSPDVLSDGVVVHVVPPTVDDDDDGLGPPVRLDGRSCVYFCGMTSRPDESRLSMWLAIAAALGIARRCGRRR
jgi:outer membrane protein assembly factor BamB